MIRSFGGEYKCAADAKGRLLIPSRIRDQIPEGESVVLVRSVDPCINLYTEERWNDYEQQIASLPGTEARDVRRFFYGSMQPVEPDGQGRVLLPIQLREHAGIEKQVVIVGCGDHAEIWDEAAYQSYAEKTRTDEILEILRRNGL